jgi:hypothetical protein
LEYTDPSGQTVTISGIDTTQVDNPTDPWWDAGINPDDNETRELLSDWFMLRGVAPEETQMLEDSEVTVTIQFNNSCVTQPSENNNINISIDRYLCTLV